MNSYKSNAEKMFIEHYGVRGMKWGVRKDRARSSIRRAVKKTKDISKKVASSTDRGIKKATGKIAPIAKRTIPKRTIPKNRVSSEQEFISALKKKHPSRMTNAELQMLTTRLNLENNYRSAKIKSSKLHRGAMFVKNMTRVVTTAAGVYALRKSPLVKDVAFAFASNYVKRSTNANSPGSGGVNRKTYNKPTINKMSRLLNPPPVRRVVIPDEIIL